VSVSLVVPFETSAKLFCTDEMMVRQRNMQTTTNTQMGLLDSLMIATPTNEFLERLDRTLDWKPLEKALQAMYPATTGRPPCPPLS